MSILKPENNLIVCAIITKLGYLGIQLNVWLLTIISEKGKSILGLPIPKCLYNKEAII